MDEKILNAITSQLQVVNEKFEFTPDSSGSVFKNAALSYKIGHNEGKNLLIFEIADVNEMGEIGDYKQASSWLFEDTDSVDDAASAGLDFLDTLKGKLGIRGVRTDSSGEVVLPKSDNNGSKNLESLCARTLALFPQYKDYYKDHVSIYGKLLAVKFFKETLMVKLIEALDNGTKKSNKKIFDMLSDMYVDGDRNVQSIIVGIVLAGATRGDEKRTSKALEYLEDYEYLKPAFKNILPLMNKGKKAEEIFKDL